MNCEIAAVGSPSPLQTLIPGRSKDSLVSDMLDAGLIRVNQEVTSDAAHTLLFRNGTDGATRMPLPMDGLRGLRAEAQPLIRRHRQAATIKQ